MRTPNTKAGAVTEDVMARVRRNLPDIKTYEYNRTYEAVLESMQEHWPDPSQTDDVRRALCEEHKAVEALMDIVEGCHGKRWNASGVRLVDTPEWCRLYSTRCRVNDANSRAQMMLRPPNTAIRPNTTEMTQSMDTKPGDIIKVESEDGILHEMTVKSVDQNNRTVTGEVTCWKTDSHHETSERKIVQTVTVPDHSIR